MKKTAIFAASLTLFLSLPLSAQFLGHLRSAETSGLGSLNLQTGAGVYEDAFTVMGRARYGIAGRVDLTLSLALLDLQDSDGLNAAFGTDLLFQVSDYDLGRALDMAVGGFLEYYSAERSRHVDYSNLAIGGQLVASRPVEIKPGVDLVPYGRLNLRVNRVEVGNNSDSDFNIGVNLGAVFPISGHIDLSGEVQLDDQFGFILGVEFLMW
jgi:hypothetical protein